ncbi:phospholipase D-like domain-containing protein [Longimicrobium sp.]|uniref:phospholipase D-like domain-containing protein n=1 Tax=Longimicrobium sp. TaxID=2029185 RepID=UPI002E34FB68|nr:phospholipase D-like domain-containing protein [Longimicrobium sp.]HEX6042571.1 phospholipase D-like domain-containing protein [Longimicrobium sp.]
MTDFFSRHPWWLLVLAVVGAIALISAVLTLFFGLGRPRRMALVARPPVGSEAFMLAVSGAVNAPLMRGGTARLLNNGDQIFPAILDALREAKHSINFMVYIWEDGNASDQMIEALTERARAGVQVRLLLDGFGAHAAPMEKMRALQEAGGVIKFFGPFRFGRLTAAYKRNHRRAIVIDGETAFTGGAAIGDKWLGHAQDEDHWRDVMVEVRGCLATNLQSSFTQLWANLTGEILVGDEFYPPNPGDDQPGGEELSRHVNVISSPASVSHPLRTFFLISLDCARDSIYLTNAYFAPDVNTRRVLEERARAGVDVRLLLPNHHTDARIVRWAGQAYYRSLLDAGVRIYEYQPTMIHAKMLVVDGVWSIVGSANMDIRSKELNQEGVIGIMDGGFGAEVRETFLEDLEHAREITKAEWDKRGWLARCNERLWVSFANQF